MNKLIIGLLVVATGAGAFFLLNKKKNNDQPIASINKEFIIGQWKTVAVQPIKDSAALNVQYNFQHAGRLIQSVNDSVAKDSSHYEWNKANELVWKAKETDSTGKIFVVLKLTTDSLQLQARDSSTVLLTKVK